MKRGFSYKSIPGWFTFPKLYQLAVADAREGDVLVEVGAWAGRSTAFLGRAVKESGKKLRVLVVDTFQGSPNEQEMVSAVKLLGGSIRGLFETNMRLAGISEVLEIRQARSVDAAGSLPDRSCSFVFIDADHRYQAVRADIRAWRKKVRPGGMLAGHDCYTYPEVFAAVRDELGRDFITTDENVWIHPVRAGVRSKQKALAKVTGGTRQKPGSRSRRREEAESCHKLFQ